MALIDTFRETCPPGRPWSLRGLAAIGAAFALVYQAVPLVILLDLSRESTVGVVFLTPLLGAGVAASIGHSHNKRLGQQPRRA